MTDNKPKWMTDDLVKDIPEKKLLLLEELYMAGQGKTQDNLMRTLLPILAKAKEENISFNNEEMTLAVAAIQKHSTVDENNQINKLLRATQKRPE